MKYKTFSVLFILMMSFLIFVNIFVLESFSNFVLKQSDNLVSHIALSKSKLNQTKVISLGDSHVSYASNINSSLYLNLAFPSDNTVMMYAKLRYFYKNGLRPDVLLLQADAHMFTSYREKFDYSSYSELFTKDLSEKVQKYYPYTEIIIQRDILGYPLYQMRTDIAANIHVLFLRYILNPASINLKHNILENGTLINKGSWMDSGKTQRDIKAERRVREQFPTSRAVEVDILRDYYMKIIKFGEEHNIKIVLIQMPLSSEYREKIYPFVNEKTNNYFQKLAAEEDLVLIDYKASLEDVYFANEDHLNYSSSKVFGLKLKQDLCRKKLVKAYLCNENNTKGKEQ